MPAPAIEAGIADALRAHLAKPTLIFALIPDLAAPEVAAFNDCLRAVVGDCDPTHCADRWAALLRRADLAQGRIEMRLDRKTLAQMLGVPAERLSSDGRHIAAPFRLQRRGVETRIILGDATPRPDVVLAGNILTARRWYLAIREGASFSAVAKRDKTTPSRIQHMIGLAFLAPDLLDLIAAGSQPLGLTSEWIKRHSLPPEWQAQRDALTRQNQGTFHVSDEQRPRRPLGAGG